MTDLVERVGNAINAGLLANESQDDVARRAITEQRKSDEAHIRGMSRDAFEAMVRHLRHLNQSGGTSPRDKGG